MIAIDTNVLVRLVTDDDPEQAQLAQDALESAARTGTVLVIVNVVLCELVWVLTCSYGYTKLQCIHVLDSLLGFPALSFESRKLARNAMLAWRGSKAGFADAMIGLVAAELGAEFVLSFDKNACAPGVASAAAVIGSAARDRREISSPLPSTSWTGPRGDYAGRRQKARPDPGFPPKSQPAH